MKYLLLSLFALLLFSQNANSQNNQNVDLTKITVNEYIELLRSVNTNDSFHFVTIEVNAPKNWITEKDIEYLITLLNSEEKVNCVTHMYSSEWPSGDSTLSSQAALLIDSYRLQKEYPHFLTKCAITEKYLKEIRAWADTRSKR